MMTTRVMKKRIFTIQTMVNLNRHLGLFLGSLSYMAIRQKEEKKGPNDFTVIWTFFMHVVGRSWPVGVTGVVGWVVSSFCRYH